MSKNAVPHYHNAEPVCAGEKRQEKRQDTHSIVISVDADDKCRKFEIPHSKPLDL
ncbi:MAG: hypothetical protein JWM11_2047 [Planctomycetaceae bacterium]|nr:hypothetical protein [Planctomycetaceae bacterium]